MTTVKDVMIDSSLDHPAQHKLSIIGEGGTKKAAIGFGMSPPTTPEHGQSLHNISNEELLP
jgi:hypothetical protein